MCHICCTGVAVSCAGALSSGHLPGQEGGSIQPLRSLLSAVVAGCSPSSWRCISWTVTSNAVLAQHWKPLLPQVDVEKPLGLKLKAAKGPNGGLTVEVSTCMSSQLPAPCLAVGCCFAERCCEYCSSMVRSSKHSARSLHGVNFHPLRLFHLQNASGNAAKAGIKSGDTVIYTSSFFGDELWPSDKLGFTRSALANAPSPVSIFLFCLICFVCGRCNTCSALANVLGPGDTDCCLQIAAWHMGVTQSPVET